METLVKHSVTKKSDIFNDPAFEDDKMTIFKNLKKLNMGLPIKNFTELESLCVTFSKFGLSKNEAKVYVYLAKFGEQKAFNISRSLSLHRTETYKILKKLEEKSMVYRILEKPIRFASTQVEKALENMIEVKKLKLLRLEEEKRRIVNEWSSISVQAQDIDAPCEFIQILKGKSQIYIKVNEIIENAEDEILITISDEKLLQMFYSGTLDDLASKSSRVKVRLITNASLKSSYLIKKLKLGRDEFFYMNMDLPSFIISGEYLLLFIDKENINEKNGQRALWTNQREMIKVLKASFCSFIDKSELLKTAS